MNDKSPRSPLDFYPTPSEVTHVVTCWLAHAGMSGAMLDPAAGDGALIAAARDVQPEAHWSAIELDPGRAAELELHAESVYCTDALTVEWPAANVLANPPFSSLDDFWKRTCEHRAKHRCWAAVFAPIAWFSAEKRAGYVRPDAVLQLGWRPVFRRAKLGPAHKGSQDFAWLILYPQPTGASLWQRIEKPRGAPSLDVRETA